MDKLPTVDLLHDKRIMRGDAVADILCLICDAPTIDAEPITGETSDGYHTFNELYHHRAVLFSVIVKFMQGKAWKSKKAQRRYDVRWYVHRWNRNA